MTSATIRVNGEERPLPPGGLAELLAELGYVARPGIAVAVNGAIVERARWARAPLAPGDEVEIVAAVQGG